MAILKFKEFKSELYDDDRRDKKNCEFIYDLSREIH